jgi:hypothetical protein
MECLVKKGVPCSRCAGGERWSYSFSINMKNFVISNEEFILYRSRSIEGFWLRTAIPIRKTIQDLSK